MTTKNLTMKAIALQAIVNNEERKLLIKQVQALTFSEEEKMIAQSIDQHFLKKIQSWGDKSSMKDMSTGRVGYVLGKISQLMIATPAELALMATSSNTQERRLAELRLIQIRGRQDEYEDKVC